MRWLPWRERFYGNCISCTRSRRTVNALERRHASLKIESQLSIDEELASIERMTYSGRRFLAPRARAPAAHLHTIESAEESVRMMRACQSARPMLLLLRDSQGGTGEPSPASASSPSLFAACASLAGARGYRDSGESEGGGVGTEMRTRTFDDGRWVAARQGAEVQNLLAWTPGVPLQCGQLCGHF